MLERAYGCRPSKVGERRVRRRRILLVAITTSCAIVASCSDGERNLPMDDLSPAVAETTTSLVVSTSSPAEEEQAPVSYGATIESGSAGPTSTLAVLTVAADSDGPRVLLIGDSSMAGLRWYDGVADQLRAARYTLDVESCRRIVLESCMGREDRVAPTVLDVVRSVTHDEVPDLLVVMAGYNDDGAQLGDAARAVGELAEARGIRTRIWLRFSNPNPVESHVNTAAHNDQLNSVANDPTTASWILADWPTFASFANGVFEADGIHLTPSGARELAAFVSDVVATVTKQECIGVGQSEACPAGAFIQWYR